MSKNTPKTSSKELRENVHDSLIVMEKMVEALNDLADSHKNQRNFNNSVVKHINKIYALMGFLLGAIISFYITSPAVKFIFWIVAQVTNLFNSISADTKWQTLIVGPIMFVFGIIATNLFQKKHSRTKQEQK